jgi:hypothetical protein
MSDRLCCYAYASGHLAVDLAAAAGFRRPAFRQWAGRYRRMVVNIPTGWYLN